MTLSLDGLALGTPLTRFDPRFDLSGLGIDYKNGPVEIGGLFLRETITVDGQQVDEYDGAAISIKTATFALSAIGWYAYYNNAPSMFIYAVLDYPLGGPVFFFDHGLAAWFGYNRLLRVPTVDQVATFPLVQEAVSPLTAGSDVRQEIQRLHTYIPPSTGSIFLAVGIKFTSFKMIEWFAMLVLVFGARFEVDVLGLSTLIVPTPAVDTAGVTPLAEVQMALLARFVPSEGFLLGVSAQLTSNSYILSRNCHLTGGFAFYAWFAGEHAGDFVQTLGGYHPSFQPPSHYPIVPRLGFNWRVNSKLTLKGSADHALTASLLMAGGQLQANWEDGKLRVWFNMGIDFLIGWKPFHYSGRAYVDIGASYTFHFFGTHHVTAHVGADVNVWGPDFSGTAHIDLSVVSFDITFGSASSRSPSPINWTTFRRVLSCRRTTG